jgi:hypothetical protein
MKKPTFILFKRGGHYEFYYGKRALNLAKEISRCLHFKGRHIANDLAGFVRENAFSPLRALTPADFPAVKNDVQPFIVDFFSPVSHLFRRLGQSLVVFSFVHPVCIYCPSFAKHRNNSVAKSTSVRSIVPFTRNSAKKLALILIQQH